MLKASLYRYETVPGDAHPASAVSDILAIPAKPTVRCNLVRTAELATLEDIDLDEVDTHELVQFLRKPLGLSGRETWESRLHHLGKDIIYLIKRGNGNASATGEIRLTVEND